MADERVEDIGLVAEQFDDLNRQFFNARHAHHVFLKHRLQGAMLVGDGGEHVQAALDAGSKVGDLQSTATCARTTPRRRKPNKTLPTSQPFEAIVLFHHAAETLLRLMLALDAPCPSLEVARLKQPGAYSGRVKRELRGRLSNDATRDTLARSFYGKRDRNSTPDGVDADARTASMEGLTVLLDECCAKLDGEAPLYNSAKHGLSAVSGNAAMQLGDRDEPILSASGTSITLLETATDTQVGRKRWRHPPLGFRRPNAGTHVRRHPVGRKPWTVARHRYLRVDGPSPLHAHRQGLPAPQPTPRGGPRPGYRFTVASMGMGLLYEVDTPAIKLRLEAAGRRNRKRR